MVYLKCAANFAGSYRLPEWVSALVQSLTLLQVTISRHVGYLNRIFYGTTRIVVRLNLTELLVCSEVVWKQMNYCTFNLDLMLRHNKAVNFAYNADVNSEFLYGLRNTNVISGVYPSTFTRMKIVQRKYWTAE